MRNIDELRKVLQVVEQIRTEFGHDLEMEAELETVCKANAGLVRELAAVKAENSALKEQLARVDITATKDLQVLERQNRLLRDQLDAAREALDQVRKIVGTY